MNTAARLTTSGDDDPGHPRTTGFALAVLRRFDARTLGSALAILVVVDVLGRISRVGMAKRFPVPATHAQSELLVNALFVGAMAVAMLACDEAVARGARRWRTYLLATLAACLAATWIQYEALIALSWDDMGHPGDDWVQPLGVFSSHWLYCTIACVVYVNRRTAHLAGRRLHEAELARASSRRRTLESRLQAMQARVEPQFLFNTLAQVRELYLRDAQAASRMLEDLIAYLRAALPHLRESSSTLGQEVALARAYLDIMRIRLGEKLRFEIELPQAVAGARMPPMMLLPLIDHALVYGLQPGRPGGDIHIATHVRDGRIVLAITDSGAAFLPDAQADDLEGIARRLHALYGDDARFELERIVERGTRATLEIPYEIADGRHR
ncbi:MAG: sensor histidine kinase [Vitreoscilla sp.]